MRVTLMHDPKAGHEWPPRVALLAMFRKAGYGEVQYQSVKAGNFARALEDPGDCVVIAGGDGTVGRVATHLVGRRVPVAILPMGTANNIARTLGLPATTPGGIAELIAGLRSADRRRLDVGVARAPWGDTHFLESVGVGVFAHMLSSLHARGPRERRAAASTPRERTEQGLRALQRVLRCSDPTHRHVLVDGEDVSGRYLLLEAMLIQSIGPQIVLAPSADPGDGLLDVVAITERERDALDEYFQHRLDGRTPSLRLPTRRARRVQLGVTGAELHVDAELWHAGHAGPSAPAAPPATGPTWSGIAGATISLELAAASLEVLIPPRGRRLRTHA
jgi:diacylglycerol kinase family enzyme